LKRALIVVGVLLVLGSIVYFSIRSSRQEKGVKIYAEEVVRREISQVVKASGAIDPRVKVNISAHVVGKIEKLYVDEGDAIQKGQPFLTLEREAYLSERDRWAAQLRRARGDVRQAEVALADTRHKLARAGRLEQEGIVSSESLEGSQLQARQAELRLADAREAVIQAQANLEKAEDDLAKTTLYAPISGRVINLTAEEGEVVVSGTMNNPGSVIGIIADLSEILANVDVDETEIVHVKPGQKATLEVDAVPGRTYHGTVVKVGSSGTTRPQQPDVTFYDVEILLDAADAAEESLRPGMSVRAEILTRAQADTLVAPIQAVLQRSIAGGSDDKGNERDAEVVFVVEAGKARQREVRTGLSDETHVELLSGVKAGEQVVTGPYRALRDLDDGDAIQIDQPRAKGKNDAGGAGDAGDEADEEEEEN
jgi:HlyD family secretion protein